MSQRQQNLRHEGRIHFETQADDRQERDCFPFRDLRVEIFRIIRVGSGRMRPGLRDLSGILSADAVIEV